MWSQHHDSRNQRGHDLHERINGDSDASTDNQRGHDLLLYVTTVGSSQWPWISTSPPARKTGGDKEFLASNDEVSVVMSENVVWTQT